MAQIVNAGFTQLASPTNTLAGIAGQAAMGGFEKGFDRAQKRREQGFALVEQDFNRRYPPEQGGVTMALNSGNPALVQAAQRDIAIREQAKASLLGRRVKPEDIAQIVALEAQGMMTAPQKIARARSLEAVNLARMQGQVPGQGQGVTPPQDPGLVPAGARTASATPAARGPGQAQASIASQAPMQPSASAPYVDRNAQRAAPFGMVQRPMQPVQAMGASVPQEAYMKDQAGNVTDPMYARTIEGTMAAERAQDAQTARDAAMNQRGQQYQMSQQAEQGRALREQIQKPTGKGAVSQLVGNEFKIGDVTYVDKMSQVDVDTQADSVAPKMPNGDRAIPAGPNGEAIALSPPEQKAAGSVAKSTSKWLKDVFDARDEKARDQAVLRLAKVAEDAAKKVPGAKEYDRLWAGNLVNWIATATPQELAAMGFDAGAKVVLEDDKNKLQAEQNWSNFKSVMTRNAVDIMGYELQQKTAMLDYLGNAMKASSTVEGAQIGAIMPAITKVLEIASKGEKGSTELLKGLETAGLGKSFVNLLSGAMGDITQKDIATTGWGPFKNPKVVSQTPEAQYQMGLEAIAAAGLNPAGMGPDQIMAIGADPSSLLGASAVQPRSSGSVYSRESAQATPEYRGVANYDINKRFADIYKSPTEE